MPPPLAALTALTKRSAHHVSNIAGIINDATEPIDHHELTTHYVDTYGLAHRTVTNIITELTAAGIAAPLRAYRRDKGPRRLHITALGHAWITRRTLLPVPVYNPTRGQHQWWTPTLEDTDLLLPDDDTPGIHVQPQAHTFDQAPPSTNQAPPSP